MSDAYDLIVIGGGLVGGAIAWGAASQGASVAVLDEGDIAYRAARGNFGLVWVQSKGAGMPPYAHWTRRSADLWPRLADVLRETTGTDVALRQPGGLDFCLSESEFAERAALVARMHNESGDAGTRMLRRDEVRAMVPGLGQWVVGAAFSSRQPIATAACIPCRHDLRPHNISAGPPGRRDRTRPARVLGAPRRGAFHRRKAGDRRRARQSQPGADGRPGHAGQPAARPDPGHRAAARRPTSCARPRKAR